MDSTTTILTPPMPEEDKSSFPKKTRRADPEGGQCRESYAYNIGRQIVAPIKAYEDFVDAIVALDAELPEA